MAMTPCNVTTSVIAGIGTNPAERGLTTDQFKAKFDEASGDLKDWVNDTHLPELNTKFTAYDNQFNNNWVPSGETWTYASATTITVPSDATLKYKKGDKIKLVQAATTKYFYVIGVTSTVLTITGGSDYTLTNDAITSNYFSHGSPIGFPLYFNCTVASWATSGTAFTNAPTVLKFIMSINVGRCFVDLQGQMNATSGATGIVTATVTSGQLPAKDLASAGPCINISTGDTGTSYIVSSNQIAFSKYDKTIIAGNSQFFQATLSYCF